MRHAERDAKPQREAVGRARIESATTRRRAPRAARGGAAPWMKARPRA